MPILVCVVVSVLLPSFFLAALKVSGDCEGASRLPYCSTPVPVAGFLRASVVDVFILLCCSLLLRSSKCVTISNSPQNVTVSVLTEELLNAADLTYRQRARHDAGDGHGRAAARLCAIFKVPRGRYRYY